MELCVIMWSVSRFVNLSFWSLMHWCDDVFIVLIVLQLVLANGDIVKTASRARKSAAGFVIFLSLYSLIKFTCWEIEKLCFIDSFFIFLLFVFAFVRRFSCPPIFLYYSSLLLNNILLLYIKKKVSLVIFPFMIFLRVQEISIGIRHNNRSKLGKARNMVYSEYKTVHKTLLYCPIIHSFAGWT